MEYKFYGQFNPPVDEFIFTRYFLHKNIKGVFVECGAFDGLIESSCKFFEETMGWSGYNLEPVPWLYKDLLRNRPESNNLNCGLSNFDGKAKFQHAKHPKHGIHFGNGSISHVLSHLKMLEEDGCEFIPIEINVLTWKSFVDSVGLTHVDLFVLDVEGHELQVIDGMRQSSVLPDIICIEVGHLSSNVIQNKLEKLGYLYDIKSHINAFFVKKDKIHDFND